MFTSDWHSRVLPFERTRHSEPCSTWPLTTQPWTNTC